MLTLYVTGDLAPGGAAVDVDGADTMKCVKEKVAKALGVVRPDDMEVVHVDCDLGDLNMKVCETGLGEGDSVEARPTRRYVARRKLTSLGMRCTGEDLMEKVLFSRGIVATEEEKAHIVELMVECDPEIVNSTVLYEKSILLLAVESGHEEVARALLRHGAQPFPQVLYAAIIKGYTSLAIEIINLGVDVNAIAASGYTPLRAAITKGRTEIVEVLIAQGATQQPSYEDGVIMTPLELARQHNQQVIARMLEYHMAFC